jgi:hypothetical protein
MAFHLIVGILPSEAQGAEKFARSCFGQESVVVVDDARDDGAGDFQSGGFGNHYEDGVIGVCHDLRDIFLRAFVK